MQPLAVITMAFNESDKLPLWLAHYDAEVGLEHCTVVDHGGTDGSTDDLRGANRLRLPRSAQDNDRRTAMIADLAAGLLQYYRRVAYVDVDELLVADPLRHASLAAYADAMDRDAVTAIGVEIVEAHGEAALDGCRGVGAQRATGLFSSSMCKTSVIGRRVTWAPGFHAHDGPPRFDDLYLFHLRHADTAQALARLKVTSTMPWVHDNAGLHQRVTAAAMTDLVRLFGSRPLAPTGLAAPDASIRHDCAAFIAAAAPAASPQAPWHVPLAIYGRERLALEPRFVAALSRAPSPSRQS